MTGDPPTSPIPTDSVIEEVIELRRHFHRHPEVSFSEHETSNRIGERLRELGLELSHVQPRPAWLRFSIPAGRVRQ